MAKKHTNTKAARTASERGVDGQHSDANVSEERVARERAQLLVERQAELDGVLDRHDDMVRGQPGCVSLVRLTSYIVSRSARYFIWSSL